MICFGKRIIRVVSDFFKVKEESCFLDVIRFFSLGKCFLSFRFVKVKGLLF